jgi:hypothetical protein
MVEGGSPSTLPTADAVLDALAAAPESLSGPGQPAQQAQIDSARQYEHLLGLQRHYRHKSQWSYFLMAMMFGMLAFQSVLLGLVGSAEWDFKDYEWLLPALLVQNLAQIAGLCVIVVKALFSDVERPSLPLP